MSAFEGASWKQEVPEVWAWWGLDELSLQVLLLGEYT